MARVDLPPGTRSVGSSLAPARMAYSMPLVPGHRPCRWLLGRFKDLCRCQTRASILGMVLTKHTSTVFGHWKETCRMRSTVWAGSRPSGT